MQGNAPAFPTSQTIQAGEWPGRPEASREQQSNRVEGVPAEGQNNTHYLLLVLIFCCCIANQSQT